MSDRILFTEEPELDEKQRKEAIKEALDNAYLGMKEKGYSPIDQLVGYLRNNDPSYLTNNRDTRKMLRAFDVDEVLEVLLESYFGWSVLIRLPGVW